MSSDEFDDFDLDFVNSASNKVKTTWSKNNLEKGSLKDLTDVTNTLSESCPVPSKKKKGKDNFIDSVSVPGKKKATEAEEFSESDEEVSDSKKSISRDVSITPPGSPGATPDKPGRGAKRTKKTEQALKKIQKAKENTNAVLRNANTLLNYEDRCSNYRPRSSVEDNSFELKVRWKADVLRIEVDPSFRMSQVLEAVAGKAGVTARELSLYQDQVSGAAIPRDATVRALGLSIVSVLHARVKVVTVEEDGEEAGRGEQGIEVKLQTKDRRAKHVTLRIEPQDKMETVMEKFCQESELERAQVKFFFDGELLNPDETAEDLELEGGECIDVHVNEK